MTRELLVLLALSLTPVLHAADPDPAMLLELARAKRLREARAVSVVTPKRTTCDCGVAGKCLCFVGECACPACGLGTGGSPKQAGKPQVSSTTRPTPVPRADTRAEPAPGRGSSADTSGTTTSTPALSAVQIGGTTSGGCANGQCAGTSQGRTYSRGLFRLR